ncbi:Dabb family protein [Thorsellia anophelis]|uniref:Stress responsive A/B Barrel Domain n=1 Tax=Thorsellia anophelis DSM 18579 TaxID=1123402 RepID=A0A1I0DDT8_9GAMM|nr:Dabb family protein [Thorsellia anophelis]SET30193.1 Stress responsive A/B Barrel Domain [Thorsellia anophelis DSM 18579]
MIRHIVLFRLHEFADGFDKNTNIERVKAALLACKSLPGIEKFEVITAKDGLEATMDVLLDTVFTDKSALDAYQVAPIHQEAVELIGKVRSARECFDYEI